MLDYQRVYLQWTILFQLSIANFNPDSRSWRFRINNGQAVERTWRCEKRCIHPPIKLPFEHGHMTGYLCRLPGTRKIIDQQLSIKYICNGSDDVQPKKQKMCMNFRYPCAFGNSNLPGVAIISRISSLIFSIGVQWPPKPHRCNLVDG